MDIEAPEARDLEDEIAGFVFLPRRLCMDGQLISARDVAKLFGIPLTTAWKWSRRGGPLHGAVVRIGHRVRFKADAIHSFIAAGGTTGSRPLDRREP
jgi:hypothetical protein